ncbi:hypothetical protein HDU93_004674 [Gonapodya sp. JEL0774]|nr:hypothetical protein HDU93_004674 [Gonapodya sp. JEL0774]
MATPSGGRIVTLKAEIEEVDASIKSIYNELDAIETWDRQQLTRPLSPFHRRRPGGANSLASAPDDEAGETSGAETSDSGISDRRVAGGRNPEEERMKTWRKLILRVQEDISNLRCGPKFKSLNRQEDQEMNKFAREHVDLDSIKKGVRNGTINTTAQFHRHVLLMTLNHLMFYREGTPKHAEAYELREQAEDIVRSCRMNLERVQGRRKDSLGASDWPFRGESAGSGMSLGSDFDRSSPVPPDVPQSVPVLPLAPKEIKPEGHVAKKARGK